MHVAKLDHETSGLELDGSNGMTGERKRGKRNRHAWLRYGMARRWFNVVFLATLLVWGIAASAIAAPIRVLALGDSLTAGYGLSTPESFPSQLETALRQRGHDVVVLNAGLSGDTTAGGLARLDWALGDKPDAALVELGANDALRGLDPAQAERNLDAILTRLTAAKLPILLAGMRAPPNLGKEYGTAFNGMYQRLTDKHGAALYPFFLDGVAGKPELNQPDGIHPTAEGIRVIVERILPAVEQLVSTAKSGVGR